MYTVLGTVLGYMIIVDILLPIAWLLSILYYISLGAHQSL